MVKPWQLRITYDDLIRQRLTFCAAGIDMTPLVEVKEEVNYLLRQL